MASAGEASQAIWREAIRLEQEFPRQDPTTERKLIDAINRENVSLMKLKIEQADDRNRLDLIAGKKQAEYDRYKSRGNKNTLPDPRYKYHTIEEAGPFKVSDGVSLAYARARDSVARQNARVNESLRMLNWLKNRLNLIRQEKAYYDSIMALKKGRDVELIDKANAHVMSDTNANGKGKRPKLKRPRKR